MKYRLLHAVPPPPHKKNKYTRLKTSDSLKIKDSFIFFELVRSHASPERKVWSKLILFTIVSKMKILTSFVISICLKQNPTSYLLKFLPKCALNLIFNWRNFIWFCLWHLFCAYCYVWENIDIVVVDVGCNIRFWKSAFVKDKY